MRNVTQQDTAYREVIAWCGTQAARKGVTPAYRRAMLRVAAHCGTECGYHSRTMPLETVNQAEDANHGR